MEISPAQVPRRAFGGYLGPVSRELTYRLVWKQNEYTEDRKLLKNHQPSCMCWPTGLSAAHRREWEPLSQEPRKGSAQGHSPLGAASSWPA